MSTHVGNPCLWEAFQPHMIADKARAELAGINFDTLVGTGFSGALVVPSLARELNRNFLLLRKPGDSHHHGSEPAEGDLGERWLFVDDGIQTGATLARVRAVVPQIARRYGQRTEFAGAYIYGHDRGTPSFIAPDHWLMDELSLAA
jgi:adenine/guanine phosphoribosyltransferase-like PRPP-binding protein